MAFAELKSLLHATFGDGSDPVVVLTGTGLVLFANAGARSRWQEGTQLERGCAFGKAVLPALAAAQPTRIEWGDEGPGGVQTWFACSIAPLADDGQDPKWLCVSTAITELKRNEERLRRSEQLMVDAQGVAHLGTWEWDIKEPHAHWSTELYRIYGLTPQTYTPSYEAYLQMVHPEDRQRVIDATNRVFQEHIPYSHDERIFRPDGSMRYLHTWAHPILDEQGQLRRLLGVCQDITDRAEAEENVRRLNMELERRVEERTRQLEVTMRDLEAFNAMVSHDLRTPLNTIELASAVMARPGAQPSDIARARERLRRAISQMTNLIDDLLAFARIDKVQLERVEVDVSCAAQEILSDLQQLEPTREVEVLIQPTITCFADRGLFRLALGNLLGNAWKYTSRVAKACIEVRADVMDGRQVLVVRDNGAGFDMKDAQHMFEPFQRLHSELDFAGTGVGLASVRRIVERHGKRVWAEGKAGVGATFYVELP